MKAAVLLSGGVDSSVALHLLRQQHDCVVTACYLKVWLEEEVLTFAGDCPWEEDLRYVRATCDAAGVPLQVVPLQTEYRERIVEHVLTELRAGRTPSPDVFCNRRIKFGAFLELLDAGRFGAGADVVVSGHYARLEHDASGGVSLLRAVDPVKDQTYFLSRMTQAQLRRTRFPVGGLPKAEVRRVAATLSLPSRHRPDSQGICFLGKIDYRQFVEFHLGRRPGAIVDVDTGARLGGHHGYWFYTIGQRFGLGLSGGPWYVVGKDVAANVVRVAHGGRRRGRAAFEVTDLHWIGGAAPAADVPLEVKLRHGPRTTACRLRLAAGGLGQVELTEPDDGIAPGQHAVFYAGQVCLGSGLIA